ncbi:MAG: glycosyltransferase [Aestuariibaculum sp.]
MNKSPSLSVHILTYNCEKYIEATLKSVLAQKTTFKFEIVIGDDHSNDGTNQILSCYAQQYPKLIRYKQNEQQLGILKNFKATLDRCNGIYVFDIAGDDLLKHENVLQKLVDHLSKDKTLGFVDSGYDEYYEKQKKNVPFANKFAIQSHNRQYKELLLLGKIFPVGVCYNKQALYDFVDFETYINQSISFEDYPILVDLAMHTNYGKINESLHIYRIHNKSFSHGKDFETLLLFKTQMLQLAKYFTEKYNLPSDILIAHKNTYHIGCLYIAGVFGQKELGKNMYLKLKKPFNLKLYGYYLCSQYKFFRTLANPLRKF